MSVSLTITRLARIDGQTGSYPRCCLLYVIGPLTCSINVREMGFPICLLSSCKSDPEQRQSYFFSHFDKIWSSSLSSATAAASIAAEIACSTNTAAAPKTKKRKIKELFTLWARSYLGCSQFISYRAVTLSLTKATQVGTLYPETQIGKYNGIKIYRQGILNRAYRDTLTAPICNFFPIFESRGLERLLVPVTLTKEVIQIQVVRLEITIAKSK